MVKKISTLLLFVMSTITMAQVGINNANPKATSDITAIKDGSKPDGLLIPRLSAAEVKSMEAYVGDAQNSMLVFITATSTTANAGKYEYIDAPGYYYYVHDVSLSPSVDNSRWMKLLNNKDMKNIYTHNGTISGTRTVTFANDNSNITFTKTGSNTKPLLVVNGTVKMTAANMNSDKRLKQNITDLLSENIDELRSVSYLWNSEGKKRGGNDKLQYGFIAQEVEKVYPNLVSTDKDGYKSINYIQIIPILTKSLQEERRINTKQQEQLDKQAKEIEELKKMLGELINDKK